ncbi:MAG: tyrosine-type recombinase/integrase [Sideroxydans sp.]|nr:tyrosine-type recombinase/integrase [Sideroxydans sp.]
MPRVAKVLTDLAVKNARCTSKANQRINDGKVAGLHLIIYKKSGAKSWRITDSNNKPHTLGHYPDMSLEDARKAVPSFLAILHEAKVQEVKIAKSSERGFEAVAERWLSWRKNFHKNGKPPATSLIDKYRKVLNKDLIPALGQYDIDDIDRKVISTLLLAVNERSNAIAIKCKQYLKMILEWSIDEEIRSTPLPSFKNIIAEKEPKPFVMPTDIRAEYLKCFNTSSKVMSIAMRLQHHIFLRSGELFCIKKYGVLYSSKWIEIDWDKKLWAIESMRMKEQRPHVIPMTAQVESLLRELHELTGHTEFLFPAPQGKKKDKAPMVPKSLSKAFDEVGIDYNPHRCRTIAGEWLKKNGVLPIFVEFLLAHQTANQVTQSYEVEPHLYFMKERLEALQKWSDYLENTAQN